MAFKVLPLKTANSHYDRGPAGDRRKSHWPMNQETGASSSFATLEEEKARGRGVNVQDQNAAWLVTGVFCPCSLLLCWSSFEGQLQQAGNQYFFITMELTLFICLLFSYVRNFFFLNLFIYLLFFYLLLFQAFSFDQVSFGRKIGHHRAKTAITLLCVFTHKLGGRGVRALTAASA